MSETTVRHQLTPVGVCNPHYEVGGFEQHDKSTKNSIYHLRTALSWVYQQAGLRRHDGRWVAHCLHVEQDYTPSTKEYSIADQHDEVKPRLKVIARISELDAAIPFPDGFGIFSELSREIRRKIHMHRTFYAYGCLEIPKCGDLINVEFEGGNNEFGKYIGVNENTDSIISDSSDIQVGSGKLANLFEKPQKAADIFFLRDQVSLTDSEREEIYISALANSAGLLPAVVNSLLAK